MARADIFSPNTSGLTLRAPDGWESPRFLAVSWLEAGSGKTALSRPAHPQVTLPVGWLHLRKGIHNEEINVASQSSKFYAFYVEFVFWVSRPYYALVGRLF